MSAYLTTQRDTASEYEAAAEWCAARGVKGRTGDPLPPLIAADVLDDISADPEAFQARVRDCAYARAMESRALAGGEA